MVVEYDDHRQLRERAARRRSGGARSVRLHREDRPDRTAPRPAHLLPRHLPGSGRPSQRQPARGRQLRHRTCDSVGARRHDRVVGRHGRPGVGHQSRMGRPAALRHDADARQPDVFINSGDTIYADQPVVAEVKLDDGTIWKNLVTEAKSKAAETVDDFRGAYKYNLHRRAHAALHPPSLADRRSGTTTRSATTGIPRGTCRKTTKYTLKSMALIAERARQAFLEYNPVPVNADDAGRIYRSVDVRAARRGVRARPAQLPRSEQRESADDDDRRVRARRRAAGRVAQGASGRFDARRGRSSPATCPSASSSPTPPRTSRRSPTATTGCRSDASSSSPAC